MDSPDAAKTLNYQVKSIEPVVIGSDVQARLFTLAPGDTIPCITTKNPPTTISY